MDISLFLAKVFGLYFLVVGLALLINPAQFRSITLEFSKNHGLTFLSGFIALILGILLIVSHNIWTADWQGFITLLGWMTFLKGTLLIVFPHRMLQLSKRWATSRVSYTLSLFSMILLGGYFCYLGFIQN